ncbi:MAG TPA: Fe-S cluster assembly protein SufD [Longimicrobiales bacterium]|nr:Fe-S cluster assembly protein SufD [Longimicrobiales bacterium]
MMEVGADGIEGMSGSFNREAVDSLDAGPEWLLELRREAWDAYERLPLPTTRLEEWRYTDPELLCWDVVSRALPVAGDVGPGDVRAAFGDREASGFALQVNGAIAAIELAPELRERGVILKSLAEAALDHESLVREHLSAHLKPGSDRFAALNAALWTAGVFIHVPRGVRLEKPIRILRWVGNAGQAYFPRTLIVAGEGSHVGILEEFASPDFDEPVFSCGAVEIHAATSADVQYVALQQWGRGVRHLSMQRTVALRDANLDTLVVNLGATVARIDLAASLEGPGSRSDMLGLYFGRDDQHFDHETRQDHRVAHATSDLLYKGALDDRSRAIFRGMIKVYPKAQRTDAYQTNRNLILSGEAESTSLPSLEIEADDVRCSHAATVGQLDEEELFYIMSRGIPRADAERLVVFGFFGDVLDRLPMPGVVRELRAAIEKKIG